MYHTIREFLDDWHLESSLTQKILDALTDESLARAVGTNDRTLGRMAWHIVTTMPEMLGRTALHLADAPGEHAPVPGSASAIAEAYRQTAAGLAAQIEAAWSDDSLRHEDDMYGAKWTRALTLQVLVRHQVHHRAQMTVLMRQAGLVVPGIYGPAREEWAAWGMPTPQI